MPHACRSSGVSGSCGSRSRYSSGTVGAVSVCKVVYVDRREIRCPCVGGDSNVPLGFVSLIENLIVIAMAIWMLVTLMAFGD